MFKPTEEQIKALEELAVLANTYDHNNPNNPKEVKSAFEAADKFMKEHREFWTWIHSSNEGWKFMTDAAARVRAELLGLDVGSSTRK